MEWILDNENKLNGVKLATVRVRPLRLAYIIPDDNPNVALRAIDSCCLTWGGILSLLIPYSRKEGLSHPWLRMIERLDPDEIIDCVGVSEASIQRFTKNGQHVHRWDRPIERFLTAGVLQYSALSAFAEGITYDRQAMSSFVTVGDMAYAPSVSYYQMKPYSVVIQPKLDSNSDPSYLPMIGRYGRLNEDFIDERAEDHGWHPEIRYANFANVTERDFSRDAEGIFIGSAPLATQKNEGGVSNYYKLVSLTGLGLNGQAASYSFKGGSPEEPQDDEAFTNTVIVTGTENSVSDLCLYWNLRLDRLFTKAFPLWIPLKFLCTNKGLKLVKLALSRTDQNIGIGLSLKPHLYVLSTSVDKEYLERKLNGKLDNAKYETEELYRFVSGKSDLYHLRENKEVYFTNGSARVPIHRCEAFEHFAPNDRVVHEASIEGVRIPQSQSLRRRLWGARPRLTRRGFENSSRVSSWPDMIPIGIPDYWNVLESIFVDAGYKCEPSDKSKFALGLLRLLGGIEELGIIASSRVYETLKAMCETRGEDREFFKERRSYQYSQLKQHGLCEHTDVILDWLIKKGLVFRGVDLTCPRCQLSRWYELDRMGKTWHCDGCQEDMAIPLKLNVTNWRYRINELYATGLDQGAVTPLLSIYALHPPAMLGSISILGYYPGIRISADSEVVAKETKVKDMEIDFVSIRDGRLIIGECKSSGEELTEDEVSRYVKLANRLRCSRVLFVTPTAFPHADQLFPRAQEHCTASIEWWEKRDILDVSVKERLSAGVEETFSDEQKADDYLEKLSQRLETEMSRS